MRQCAEGREMAEVPVFGGVTIQFAVPDIEAGVALLHEVVRQTAGLRAEGGFQESYLDGSPASQHLISWSRWMRAFHGSERRVVTVKRGHPLASNRPDCGAESIDEKAVVGRHHQRARVRLQGLL